MYHIQVQAFSKCVKEYSSYLLLRNIPVRYLLFNFGLDNSRKKVSVTSSKFCIRYLALLLSLPDWLIFILLVAVAIRTTSRNFS